MFNKIIGQAIVDKIFNNRPTASEVKTKIVTDYFKAWSTLMRKQVQNGDIKSLAYWELFCGSSKHFNSQSAPFLSILNYANAEPWLKESLKSVVFDQESSYVHELKAEINVLQQQENPLGHQPKIFCSKINQNITEWLENVSAIPSLFFLDPFGVKGFSKELLSTMIKDSGNDVILLFDFNRFNLWLGRKDRQWVLESFIGNQQTRAFSKEVPESMPSYERHSFIMEAIQKSLANMKGVFSLPFHFISQRKQQPNQYMIFMSKNFIHYHIMKEIMSNASSRSDYGVPTMAFNPKDLVSQIIESPDKITELENDLESDFSGNTLSVWSIYMKHSVGKPYTLSNYKDALIELEVKQRIKAKPFIGHRPFRNEYPTMGDNTMITFPNN